MSSDEINREFMEKYINLSDDNKREALKYAEALISGDTETVEAMDAERRRIMATWEVQNG